MVLVIYFFVSNLYSIEVIYFVMKGDLDRALKQKRAKPEAIEEVVISFGFCFIYLLLYPRSRTTCKNTRIGLFRNYSFCIVLFC